MTSRTRQVLAVGILAAGAGTGNLTFVLSRLPELHWSSLSAGIAGMAVAAVLAVLLRHEKRLHPSLTPILLPNALSGIPVDQL